MTELELTMGETPMLDTDRELMRGEFEDFDNMTLPEFQAAVKDRQNELLDLMSKLNGWQTQ